MGRAIRAYLRAAKPALSSIVTCCVTGAIPGDGGACGDCDPCLLGEASVPAPVKTLIAEKNSLIHRVGELEDELDSLRRLASSDGGVSRIVEAARDIVALWNSPKIQGLPRAERNSAIEDSRAALIDAVHELARSSVGSEQGSSNSKVAGSNPAAPAKQGAAAAIRSGGGE